LIRICGIHGMVIDALMWDEYAFRSLFQGGWYWNWGYHGMMDTDMIGYAWIRDLEWENNLRDRV
jgi:hypothetical protein